MLAKWEEEDRYETYVFDDEDEWEQDDTDMEKITTMLRTRITGRWGDKSTRLLRFYAVYNDQAFYRTLPHLARARAQPSKWEDAKIALWEIGRSCKWFLFDFFSECLKMVWWGYNVVQVQGGVTKSVTLWCSQFSKEKRDKRFSWFVFVGQRE